MNQLYLSLSNAMKYTLYALHILTKLALLIEVVSICISVVDWGNIGGWRRGGNIWFREPCLYEALFKFILTLIR